MELKKQVVSLEYAKKLKELEVKQDSHFYYHWYKKNREYERIECDLHDNKIEDFDDGKWKGICYSAFTVAELGEMLPDNCYTQKDCATLPIEWICHRVIDENQEDIWIAETEADARAQILIYLIENKSITIEQINKRIESCSQE